MESLTGVASLDVAPAHFVWHTGEDSFYARVQCPRFLTLAAHTKPPFHLRRCQSANFTKSTDSAFRLAMYASESPRIIWPRFVLWNGGMSAVL